MDDAATWDDANNTCRGAGEYLVTFATAAASQWLRAKALELSAINIGRFPRYCTLIYYVCNLRRL